VELKPNAGKLIRWGAFSATQYSMSFVHWNAFGSGFPAEDGANLPRARTESFTTHAINLWAQIKTLFVRRFGLAVRR